MKPSASLSHWTQIDSSSAPSIAQGAAIDAGGAFVYERSGSNWILVQSLAAPSTVSSDKFGNAVDVDGTTIAVGALRRNVGRAEDAGAVYVYERGRTITLEQTLVANDFAADDLFGSSLALQQLTDGSRRLVVGAENVDVAGADNAGAAYVFDSAPGAAFSQSQKLVASDPLAGAIFGTDVALFLDRILVGAPAVSGASPQSGATYVFERSAGTFSQVSKLERSPSDAQAHFGTSVALEFGYGLVGATGESIGTLLSNTGAAHAYSVIGGAFVHNHVLTASALSSPFLRRVSLSERFAISGSPHADVYRRDAYGWSLEQHFPPLASSVWTGIGIDGTTLAISGRRGAPDPTVPLGYVQVFTLDAGNWSLQQQLEPDLLAFSQPDEAAASLVVDVEGDTLVIGARRWNGGDGRVFVWKRNASVWMQSQLFTSPQADTNFDMNFGAQVILSGNTLIVTERPSSGAPGTPQNGNVFIYTRPNANGNFSEQQVLTESVPAPLDMFGLAVGFDDDVLAVYSGAAATLRVYDRQGNSFVENWNIGLTGVATEALAVAGDRIAVGVAGATVDGLSDAGEVRVYRRQPDDSYALEATFTAPSPSADMRLGWTVTLDDERVVAGTSSGRQFTFEL